ncbi:MAG: DUF4091 domain-containing protein [Prevotellaceae bacterium]|nr:DUF4091 domain-containing protein [Prevotellaceae bacterium]
MKKAILFLSVLIAGCSPKVAEKECDTFVESADPHPDAAAWRSTGFNVSFGSTDVRYAKYRHPDISTARSQKLYAWRGERVSAQLVLWTSAPLQQVECRVQALQSAGGAVIPAEAVQARFVRYVLTDVFGEGCGWRKADEQPAFLVGDMLDNIACISMEAKSVRPVWITIDVPPTAAAGAYRGAVEVCARGKRPKTLAIELSVAPKTLPPASQWRYHLDLWQHPAAVARVHNLKCWSDEHFDALRPVMKMLADAGQKVITATLNKDPWNHQCYDAYEDMIRWTKNADGTWSYDYTVFDRWVNLMMELGVNKMISCYSLSPWNNELRYRDAKSGEMVTVSADPGTKKFAEMWRPFLKDFVQHLSQNKWLEIANIAMDERPPKVMDEVLDLLGKVAPQLGVSIADNHKSYKRYPHIRDFCMDIGSIPDSADLAYRKLKGLNTTYYVCCADKFPNTFTFSDPAEAVYVAWHAKAKGLDGFLRWSYNSWVENPVLDSRFRTWPAGDTYIVYPQARSSIRFERLREGVQDYEKISALTGELEQQKTPEAEAQLQSIRATLKPFSASVKPDSLGAMLEQAKMLFRQ